VKRLEDRIIDIVGTLKRHEESISNLEKWQEKQNGKLEEVDDKLETIKNMLIGTLLSVITSLLFLVLDLLNKK